MATYNITLTPTTADDLNTLFQFQLDEEANYLAAFTPDNPGNKTAYLEKYGRFLTEPTIHMRTIRADNTIVGSIAKFIIETDAEITYWIDRKFWGQGIAQTALAEFLKLDQTRPLRGRVAFDNHASQKVLEKCNFLRIGQDEGFSNARQAKIAEYIYLLA
ncbi:GNAT family N-acetyltransferase [Hymenobacter amundsenii]|uniref:GNAT family N-acetyltransferase n=1 Tax=Hymenobacter amundsenii TaxID=2006685 RepID=A0A246FRZ2_9BACT|nr:GNAT family N-acetyltransferase [Hymenobacter amundsenii]OWP64534.1 GNAT family N-acetyltransferase [Hymenobacter amundsenii]